MQNLKITTLLVLLLAACTSDVDTVYEHEKSIIFNNTYNAPVFEPQLYYCDGATFELTIDNGIVTFYDNCWMNDDPPVRKHYLITNDSITIPDSLRVSWHFMIGDYWIIEENGNVVLNGDTVNEKGEPEHQTIVFTKSI